MIRFLNYISIVFRKAASAFDLSLFTALFSVVTSCFCRNSGSLSMSSPQPMNLTSTKSDYEMPLTPAIPVFPLSWNDRDSSVLKSFVRFSDISKLQCVLQKSSRTCSVLTSDNWCNHPDIYLKLHFYFSSRWPFGLLRAITRLHRLFDIANGKTQCPYSQTYWAFW